MQPLSLAFIGGGLDSAVGYTHLIAAQMDGRFRLKAAAFSRNAEINRKSAESWGLERDFRLYESYQTLLENERGKIDAVCVLTPTPTHKEIVLAALEVGFSVICEKTLCLNLKEALEIKRTLEAKNGFLAVTYNYTGYPMVRELREMVRGGAIGRIFNIHIEMPQEGFIRHYSGAPPTPQDWRLSDGAIPIISLDLGVHIANLLGFLCEERALSVFALAGSYGHFRVTDSVNVLAQFSGGIAANFWFSKAALGLRNGLRVRLFGEKMSAEWLQTNPEELLLATKDGERIIKDRASSVKIAQSPRYNRFKAGHPAGFIEAFANYYCDIADSLRAGALSPYVFGIEGAIRELGFFEALSESHKRGEKIDIARFFKEEK